MAKIQIGNIIYHTDQSLKELWDLKQKAESTDSNFIIIDMGIPEIIKTETKTVCKVSPVASVVFINHIQCISQ